MNPQNNNAAAPKQDEHAPRKYETGNADRQPAPSREAAKPMEDLRCPVCGKLGCHSC